MTEENLGFYDLVLLFLAFWLGQMIIFYYGATGMISQMVCYIVGILVVYWVFSFFYTRQLRKEIVCKNCSSEGRTKTAEELEKEILSHTKNIEV